MAGKQIELSQLQIPQLNQLSQQLDQEIEFFSNSLNQLKLAQGKFVESQECVKKVCPDNLSKDILVPLTSSMYVPGQLSDVNNVLVDIGTSYFVEMGIQQSQEYFKRKVEYITKQIEKIQPILQEKYRVKQATVELLQMKVQQLSATTAAKT
ncbi:hypothetical protein ScPMuIL_012262 [Solemya velum]